MEKEKLYRIGIICIFLSSPVSSDYSNHPDGIKFAEHMFDKHEFSKSSTIELLRVAKRSDSVIKAMQRPAEKTKPWHQYKKHFITKQRIKNGVAFWRKNKSFLQQAEKRFGVNAAIIVSIIGVETNYGRNVGSHRVIDALCTLAFDYYTKVEKRESRKAFFTVQLENLLLLAREQKQDPSQLIGSYAGAMGLGQFMPNSYRNFAIDFDGDQFADIWKNPGDAIGSVANYFTKHGWVPGDIVALRGEHKPTSDVDAPSNYQIKSGDTLYSIANSFGLTVAEIQRSNKLSDADVLSVGETLFLPTEIEFNKLSKPSMSIGDLKLAGLSALEPADVNRLALPIMLDIGTEREYWLGLQNFYAISRYNPRIKYAMAVYQLSELIRSQYCDPTTVC
ncbi:MAG: lytic murein transglycosylase B [Porticoccaceae bacterium]|nr:lytic murein transglycosylase B [Porticoccaceae bacterium]